MPIHNKRDRHGPYFQFGNHGKKYYYKPNNNTSRLKALMKCQLQMRAIFHAGYRGK